MWRALAMLTVALLTVVIVWIATGDEAAVERVSAQAPEGRPCRPGGDGGEHLGMLAGTGISSSQLSGALGDHQLSL